MKPWYRNPVVLLWINAALLAAILGAILVTQRYTVSGAGSSGFYLVDTFAETVKHCMYDVARQGYACEPVSFVPSMRR